MPPLVSPVGMPFIRPIIAALLLAVAPLLPAQPANAALMPFGELQPGMQGEVWTVFRGSIPEPFAVEITGVLRNALGPGKSLIVCELTDSRVQKMGAVAGMSGSPLYIGGRLAGVLSYQIQRFETVRYAGFTPIADMLEVSTMPETVTNFMAPAPLPIPGDEPPARSAASLPEWRALRPVFSLGGLSPEVVALVEPQMQALGLDVTALGGHADGASLVPSADSAGLKAGDAVAVALAVGDITVAGTGTVSLVDGNRILAFGHPMLRLGAIDLPMTTAEVVTILPSQFNSIKISNAGSVIGTFSQDRLSAVYGELGRVPALVPVEVTFPQRSTRNSLKFSIVRHEQVLPTVAATGLAQAVLGSNESGLAKGFRLTTEVHFPGRPPIAMSQLYAGPNGFAQGLQEFTRDLTQWLFNPFERIFPEKIAFRIEETPRIPLATLEVVQVSRTAVAPGGVIDVAFGWRGFQQEAATLTTTIPIDVAWAGKDLEVVLTTGRTLDEMTGRPRVMPIAQLRNFDEYAAALRGLRETDGLYLALVERTALFMDQLNATAELPGSLERIARAADDARFQRRDASVPLWERHLLPGTLFNVSFRRPLKVTD